MSCTFCDNHSSAEAINPNLMSKLCSQFKCSGGSNILDGTKICHRCQLNIDLIENAMKLRAEMDRYLKQKLLPFQSTSTNGEARSQPGDVTSISHYSSLFTSNGLPSQAAILLHNNPPPIFSCETCGDSFISHIELANHKTSCSKSDFQRAATNCFRCGESIRGLTSEERRYHMTQCKMEMPRRGRPSTGILHCPKCGQSLRNRLSHLRMRHIQRCTGSGLPRGRPSSKTPSKYQCDKCSQLFWSHDLWEVHTVKCDGTHTSRSGRKRGDNHCGICGEYLVYRHLLKKHLKHAHGVNAMALGNSELSAVNGEAGTPSTDVVAAQQYSCNRCKVTVATKELLDKHIMSCEVCHRKKGRPSKYTANQISCDICNLQFDTDSQYERHSCFGLQDKELLSHNASASVIEDYNQADHTSFTLSVALAASSEAEVNTTARTMRSKGAALEQVISGLFGSKD